MVVVILRSLLFLEVAVWKCANCGAEVRWDTLDDCPECLTIRIDPPAFVARGSGKVVLKGESPPRQQGVERAVFTVAERVTIGASTGGRIAAGGIGLTFGVAFIIVAVGSFVVGGNALLYFFPIGVCFGLPLIAGGVWVLLMGVTAGIHGIWYAVAKPSVVLKGQCPYCEFMLEVFDGSVGVDCTACKKRFVIRGMKFFRVE
jgi:DNA-directed RNA polymerase subunit RPC12/RpoP